MYVTWHAAARVLCQDMGIAVSRFKEKSTRWAAHWPCIFRGSFHVTCLGSSVWGCPAGLDDSVAGCSVSVEPDQEDSPDQQDRLTYYALTKKRCKYLSSISQPALIEGTVRIFCARVGACEFIGTYMWLFRCKPMYMAKTHALSVSCYYSRSHPHLVLYNNMRYDSQQWQFLGHHRLDTIRYRMM